MSLQHIWSERTCSAIISLPFIIISGFIPGPGTSASASLRSWLFKIEATVRQGNILQFFYVQHKGQQTGRQWKVVWVKVKELSTAEWRSLPTSAPNIEETNLLKCTQFIANSCLCRQYWRWHDLLAVIVKYFSILAFMIICWVNNQLKMSQEKIKLIFLHHNCYKSTASRH